MNLIIDVGNTLVKQAVFEEDKLIYKANSTERDFVKTFQEILELYKTIDRVIISSVGNFSSIDVLKLKEDHNVFELTHTSKIPFKNNYASPETLGVDRIALVSAAAIQFPNKNVLIIDAGSCITYDLLNSNNEYLGGAISPGIGLRYKSLHNYTEKLPLLKPKMINKIIGATTKTSIHVGVIQGVAAEVNGMIAAYKDDFKELTIILTGGDAHYLVDSLKNDIFANSNFLLEGLNHILEINTNKC